MMRVLPDSDQQKMIAGDDMAVELSGTDFPVAPEFFHFRRLSFKTKFFQIQGKCRLLRRTSEISDHKQTGIF